MGLILKEEKFDGYVARGLVLIVFTSIFYESNLYSGFASLVEIGLIWASWKVRKDVKKIVYGLSIGMIATGIGYFIPSLYF